MKQVFDLEMEHGLWRDQTVFNVVFRRNNSDRLRYFTPPRRVEPRALKDDDAAKSKAREDLNTQRLRACLRRLNATLLSNRAALTHVDLHGNGGLPASALADAHAKAQTLHEQIARDKKEVFDAIRTARKEEFTNAALSFDASSFCEGAGCKAHRWAAVKRLLDLVFAFQK